MIRARIDEDIDRLCAVLETMENFSGLPKEGLRGWLEEYDAELSWVFDMAPVSVAPTQNVVGHLQVYSAAADTAALCVEHTGTSADELLAIGKHFVKPRTYEHGIGRYLLRESVTYIRGRGKVPVLDLRGDGFFPKAFYAKFGFDDTPSVDSGVTPMVYTK